MVNKQRHLVPARGWRPREGFGDRLRMVRKTYGDHLDQRIGQREMAAAIGWGEKAYLSYEAGYHVPGDVWAFCLAMAQATGCDPLWLAGSELPPPDPDGERTLGRVPTACTVVPLSRPGQESVLDRFPVGRAA